MERNALAIYLAAIALFMMGTFATIILPFFDKEMMTPTANAEARKYDPDSPEAKGRQVYIANGCNTCHTQVVRPVKADLAMNIGPVSVPGDYVNDRPHLFGSNRTGPDLMWIGARTSKEWNLEHLKDPQKIVPGSIMPKYDYLSDEDLNNLVAYLMSLKPAPVK
ncbi:cbb3-type cytochrome c oxidase subunit II [Aneurinibacillus migulanus]|uniref:cbb3-type cytochrome c oxidase subunit II n=1 Tax=Aneurinibacillus migulanus TaxID=47500 RepID=UPI000695D198|nr:cbb3-type cytochrome c oxidase subunit II [Aneurinibacillus migulanus]MCP1355296.1 cbb3-type cytochrome c oxidase subunit II [Aneurinibacillus migulanus]CEH28218.1 Putative cytochrome c oxidase, cbb3-type, subunit II [Aneurinibacillus migulanus]